VRIGLMSCMEFSLDGKFLHYTASVPVRVCIPSGARSMPRPFDWLYCKLPRPLNLELTMARLPRFILPGYPQHVIQRGNNRQDILRDEEDYWFLWGTLRDAAQRFQCDIHAYTLMPNHFHLAVRIKTEYEIFKEQEERILYDLSGNNPTKLKPSQCLSNFLNAYAQSFNILYNRQGNLFQKPIKRKLVEDEDYLRTLIIYIHNNPVHHGYTNNTIDYRWSSYLSWLVSKIQYGNQFFSDSESFVQSHFHTAKTGKSDMHFEFI